MTGALHFRLLSSSIDIFIFNIHADFKICAGDRTSTYLLLSSDVKSFDAYKSPLWQDMDSSPTNLFCYSPCPCPGPSFGLRVKPGEVKVDVHRLLENCAEFVGLHRSMCPTVAIFEKFRFSEPKIT